MNKTPLKLGIIGGLGMMLSPAATHLAHHKWLNITKVFDRKSPGTSKENARKAWQKCGASLTNDWHHFIIDQPEIILICAGKNGSDLALLKQLHTAIQTVPNYKPALIHLSTVSPSFVIHAHDYFQSHGIMYANYPLTGGPNGAQSASMLILTSGKRKLYDWLFPILNLLGKVCYFGPKIEYAAQIKLLGHTMVFNNLLGITTASALHQEIFSIPLNHPKVDQFFELMNQGAGGSKQWPLALRKGVAKNDWQEGFRIEHALIDLLYVLQMMYQLKMPQTCQIPLYITALTFCYLEQHIGPGYATHAMVKTLLKEHKTKLDNWLQTHFIFKINQDYSKQLIKLLQDNLQNAMKLDITIQDFK